MSISKKALNTAAQYGLTITRDGELIMDRIAARVPLAVVWDLMREGIKVNMKDLCVKSLVA